MPSPLAVSQRGTQRMQGWRRKPEEIKVEIRFTFSCQQWQPTDKKCSVRLSASVCGDGNHTETQRLLKGVSQTGRWFTANKPLSKLVRTLLSRNSAQIKPLCPLKSFVFLSQGSYPPCISLGAMKRRPDSSWETLFCSLTW